MPAPRLAPGGSPSWRHSVRGDHMREDHANYCHFSALLDLLMRSSGRIRIQGTCPLVNGNHVGTVSRSRCWNTARLDRERGEDENTGTSA